MIIMLYIMWLLGKINLCTVLDVNQDCKYIMLMLTNNNQYQNLYSKMME